MSFSKVLRIQSLSSRQVLPNNVTNIDRTSQQSPKFVFLVITYTTCKSDDSATWMCQLQLDWNLNNNHLFNIKLYETAALLFDFVPGLTLFVPDRNICLCFTCNAINTVNDFKLFIVGLNDWFVCWLQMCWLCNHKLFLSLSTSLIFFLLSFFFFLSFFLFLSFR